MTVRVQTQLPMLGLNTVPPFEPNGALSASSSPVSTPFPGEVSSSDLSHLESQNNTNVNIPSNESAFTKASVLSGWLEIPIDDRRFRENIDPNQKRVRDDNGVAHFSVRSRDEGPRSNPKKSTENETKSVEVKRISIENTLPNKGKTPESEPLSIRGAFKIPSLAESSPSAAYRFLLNVSDKIEQLHLFLTGQPLSTIAIDELDFRELLALTSDNDDQSPRALHAEARRLQQYNTALHLFSESGQKVWHQRMAARELPEMILKLCELTIVSEVIPTPDTIIPIRSAHAATQMILQGCLTTQTTEIVATFGGGAESQTVENLLAAEGGDENPAIQLLQKVIDRLMQQGDQVRGAEAINRSAMAHLSALFGSSLNNSSLGLATLLVPLFLLPEDDLRLVDRKDRLEEALRPYVVKLVAPKPVSLVPKGVHPMIHGAFSVYS